MRSSFRDWGIAEIMIAILVITGCILVLMSGVSLMRLSGVVPVTQDMLNVATAPAWFGLGTITLAGIAGWFKGIR